MKGIPISLRSFVNLVQEYGRYKQMTSFSIKLQSILQISIPPLSFLDYLAYMTSYFDINSEILSISQKILMCLYIKLEDSMEGRHPGGVVGAVIFIAGWLVNKPIPIGKIASWIWVTRRSISHQTTFLDKKYGDWIGEKFSSKERKYSEQDLWQMERLIPNIFIYFE